MLDVLEHDERTVDRSDRAVVDARLQAAVVSVPYTDGHGLVAAGVSGASDSPQCAPSDGSRGVELSELLVGHAGVRLAAHDELRLAADAGELVRRGEMTAGELAGRRSAADGLVRCVRA